MPQNRNPFFCAINEKDDSVKGKFYASGINYPGYKEFWKNGPNAGPEPEFMPTYKQNSKNPGQYVNKNDQCPSFTDRVLMRNNSSQVIKNARYRPLKHVMGSDHQPVQLDFQIDNFFRPNITILKEIGPA